MPWVYSASAVLSSCSFSQYWVYFLQKLGSRIEDDAMEVDEDAGAEVTANTRQCQIDDLELGVASELVLLSDDC